MPESSAAVYPLTLFDGPNGQAGLFAGWLVEGIIDIQKMEARLRSLIVKWPLLAGRIEQVSVRHVLVLFTYVHRLTSFQEMEI